MTSPSLENPMAREEASSPMTPGPAAAQPAPAPAPAERGLAARALVGMAWAYSSYVGGRLAVLASTAVLARLLHPGDFGLVALALTFMAFLEIARDLSPSQWIVVVDEGEVGEWADTVWLLNGGLGLLLTLATAALAPLASSFFHQPRLLAIMPVLGANFLLRSLSYVHYALAQRGMDFRRRTTADVADVVTRGIVGVALALAGFGVWSLVIGYIAGGLAITVALWVLVPWRPSFRFQARHVPQLLRFGGALSGVGAMAAMLAQFDNIVVGRVLGSVALGLYVFATRLPELVIVNLSVVAGEVLFPAFARLKREGLPRPFLTSLHHTLLVGLPMAAFLGLLARPLIALVFGPRWHGAVEAMQVLAVWAVMSPISMVCGVAYKAMGRASLLFRLGLVQVALLVPLVLVFAGRGIVVVAGCQAAVAFVIVGASLFVMSRMLGVSARDLARVARVPVAASALLALLLWGIERSVGPAWLTLLVGGTAGLSAYLLLLWLWDRPTMSRLWNLMMSPLRSRRASTLTPVVPEAAPQPGAGLSASPGDIP